MSEFEITVKSKIQPKDELHCEPSYRDGGCNHCLAGDGGDFETYCGLFGTFLSEAYNQEEFYVRVPECLEAEKQSRGKP